MATVYVVDDDGLMREMLARHLEKDSHHVLCFASPMDALPEIMANRPDFIVSDVQMPGMSGLELVREIRDRDIDVPVVLITGHITTEIQNKADTLGVVDILQKPLKDYQQLSTLICDSIDHGGTAVPGLDQLRLSFLTGISHELRTPLTAIRLALDGLFAHQKTNVSPQEARLVDISQRNMDRIVNLVERQIDLLQIALGEVSVSRRLVCIYNIIEATSKMGPRHIEIPRGEPCMLFTDPERLQTVIRHILDRADAAGALQCHVDFAADEREIVFEYEHKSETSESNWQMDAANVSTDPAFVWNPSVSNDGRVFQNRVCRRIVESIGGHMTVDRDGATERVRLNLPVHPAFDKRRDFLTPIKSLREAAMLTGRNVSFIKCEIPAIGVASDFRVLEDEFLRQALSMLGEGDALVRGHHKGIYYLGLIERTATDIDHIRQRLEQRSGGDEEPGALSTSLLKTLHPGEGSPEDLLEVLDPVPVA